MGQEMSPLPPLIRVDIEGIRQTLMQHLNGYGAAWAEMTKKAMESLPLEQMVAEAVRREAAALIQVEVKRQIGPGVSAAVSEALGKDVAAQSLKRMEIRVRKAAEAAWAAECAVEG